MTNSIRPLFIHRMRGALLPVQHAQKLSPEMNVELVGRQEVFGQPRTGCPRNHYWRDSDVLMLAKNSGSPRREVIEVN